MFEESREKSSTELHYSVNTRNQIDNFTDNCARARARVNRGPLAGCWNRNITLCLHDPVASSTINLQVDVDWY